MPDIERNARRLRPKLRVTKTWDRFVSAGRSRVTLLVTYTTLAAPAQECA